MTTGGGHTGKGNNTSASDAFMARAFANSGKAVIKPSSAAAAVMDPSSLNSGQRMEELSIEETK